MKKILIPLLLMVFCSSFSVASAEWVAANPPPLVVQEQVVPQLLIPDNAIIAPAAPQPRPLVRKIKWIMTPNVTFVEAPYYTRGIFGGVVVKKQIVLHTTWVWTPVEVWE